MAAVVRAGLAGGSIAWLPFFDARRKQEIPRHARRTQGHRTTRLEITSALTLVRPFQGRGQNELVKMPKCYAFDTGFVSFVRGWDLPYTKRFGKLEVRICTPSELQP